MYGSLLRSFVLVVALSPLAVHIAYADVWHWSGLGGDANWTTPGNWTENSSYPGATEGNSDTAVFGPVAAGAHTTIFIDGVAGIKTILFSGAGTPAYTFETEEAGNVLFLENGASVSMTADVANNETFMCPIDFGLNGYREVTLRNDSVSAEMVLNGYAINKSRHDAVANDHYYMPPLAFRGKGAFRLTGGGNEYHINGMTFCQEGAVYVESQSATWRWRPKAWGTERNGSDSFLRIVIPAGSCGFGLGDGGGDANKILLEARVNTVIEGAGALPQVARIDSVNSPYVFKVATNKTLRIDVPIGGCVKSDARFSDAVGFGQPIDWRKLGAGVVELTSSNTYSGATMLVGADASQGRITVKAAKFGAKNCAATESNLGTGTWIAFIGTGGTLVNTGVGETCNRDFVLMPHYLMTIGTVATVGTLGVVRNDGTGALVLTGDVSAEGEGDTFMLDGGASGITFAGTAGGDNGMTLELARTVTLNTLPEKFIAVRMSGANVTLDDSVSSLPSVTIAEGRSVITVPDGVAFVIDSVAKASGVSGSLDIRLGNGASAKVTDFTGGSPDNLTVNGRLAAFDSEGNIVVAETVNWSAAVDGNWNDGGKWSPNGIPAAGAKVSVSVSGASYEVTVPTGVSVAPSYLEVLNGQSGETATVKFEDAVSFADKVVNVGSGGCVVAEKGADFTHTETDLGRYVSAEGGTLRVTSGSLTLPSAKGVFMPNGGVVEVAGSNATMKVPASYTFGTGDWRLTDNAGIDMYYDWASYMALAPDGAGETARMSISVMDDSNAANRKFANSACLYSTYPGGKAVMDFISYEASGLRYFPVEQGGAPELFAVGYQSGCAELNVSNGYFSSRNYGLAVGTGRHIENVKSLFSAPYAVTGTVNVAAGTLEASGWSFSYTGVCAGIILGDAQQYESDVDGYNRYFGVMNVSGGLVKGAGPAYFLLGFGRGAEGRLVQTGGEISWDCGSTYDGKAYRSCVGVGVFGGAGTWVISNGTATVKNRFFVGGAVTNEFERCEGGKAFFTAPPLAFSGGAVGTMVVAGGTTKLNNGLFVGSDGAGMVEFAPAWQDDAGNIVTGRLVVSEMVLSNQTASVLKFDLSDLGTATLAVENRLTFSPGAELVVDATRLNANSSRGWRKLMSVGSFSGDVPAPEFIVTDETRDLYERGLYLFERNGEKGLWVHAALRGLVISVR